MNQYLQLFLSSMQSGGKHPGKGTVVAFTSSLPEEGVSFVVESFAVEIARKTHKRILIADLDALQHVDIIHYSRVAKYCYQTDVKNLYVLPSVDQLDAEEEPENPFQLQPKRGSDSGLDRGVNNLQTLRSVFDFILLDCPSLKASGDAALFSKAVNGIILVVEAERTRKEQVRSAMQTIEMAKGNLLGCVLNKRQYPVPDWLYQRI